MDKKHQKHTNLTRRKSDNYALSEIAILGSKCSKISNLVQKIAQKQQKNAKIGYLDASHAEEKTSLFADVFTYHHLGGLEAQTNTKLNSYNSKIELSQYDLVFINGNHFQGAKQILILDPEKEKSIQKRIDQITDIQCIIKLDDQTQIFDCLLEKFPNIKELPSYTIDQIDAISNYIETIISTQKPQVKGLVLVGGKSTRMGTDKSALNYFGKSQKEHTKELLESCGLETFVSAEKSSNNEQEIHDTFLNLGPFGGICSAFQKDPNSALLVLAIDLPFVDKNLIIHLLEQRNSSKVATAIKGEGKDFPEPLITIYEPKAYPILLQYLAQGYSCPRKMLINSDVEIVEVDDALIRNVNTKDEFENAKKELNG